MDWRWLSIMIRAHRKGIRVFKNCTKLLWGCCSQRPHYLPLFFDLWPSCIEGQCPQEEEGATSSNHGTVFMLDFFRYYRKTIRHLKLCISLKTSLFYSVSLHMHTQTHFSGNLNKLFSWSKTSAILRQNGVLIELSLLNSSNFASPINVANTQICCQESSH